MAGELKEIAVVVVGKGNEWSVMWLYSAAGAGAGSRWGRSRVQGNKLQWRWLYIAPLTPPSGISFARLGKCHQPWEREQPKLVGPRPASHGSEEERGSMKETAQGRGRPGRGSERGRGAAKGERPPSAAVTHDLKNLWEKHGWRPRPRWKSAHVGRAHKTTAATATTTHCCCCCCNSIHAIFCRRQQQRKGICCATSSFQLAYLSNYSCSSGCFNFQGLSKKIIFQGYGDDFVMSSKARRVCECEY